MIVGRGKWTLYNTSVFCNPLEISSGKEGTRKAARATNLSNLHRNDRNCPQENNQLARTHPVPRSVVVLANQQGVRVNQQEHEVGNLGRFID